MNKLLTKIVGGILGISMAIGVGFAVSGRKAVPAKAAEEVFYTLEPASGTNNSYTGNCDVTIEGMTWNVTGNSQMQPWRLGGKSITGTDRTVYSKTAMGSAISKVELVVGAASSITVNSLSMIVGNSGFTSATDTVAKTFAANSTITFTPTSGDSWATGQYYKFVFNVTVSGSSNKFVQFTRAIFYHMVDESTPDFTLDKNSISLTVGGASTTITATPNEHVSGSAMYSWNKTAGDDCVTLTNANTATVTVAPKGTAISASCTLTITVTGCESKTVSVTVKKVSSETNPFTVAEAKELIDLGVAEDMSDVYVHGIISSVESFNSTYKSITYWISDDGTSNEFEVYSGKGLDNADFASASDLEAGYEVTIRGTVKKYNSTYEFDKNSYIVDLVRPNTYAVSTTTNGLTLSTNEIGTTGSVTMTTAAKKKGTNVVVGGTATSSISENVVTLSNVGSDVTINATIVDASITSLSLEGQTTKFAVGGSFSFDGTVSATYDDWVSPHTSEAVASGYVVDDSDVDMTTEGTYEVVVSYAGVSTSYDVRVAVVFDNTKGEYHEVTSLDQLYDGAHVAIVDAAAEHSMLNGFTSTNNVSATEVTADANTSTISKANVLDVELVKVAENTYRFKIDDDSYLYAASSSSNQLKVSTLNTTGDNGKFLISLSNSEFTVTAQGDHTRNTMRFNPNNGTPIFSCYASTSTTGSTVAFYVFETYVAEANEYAKLFIGTGSSNQCANTISNWSTLKTAFSHLTDGAKSIFANAEHADVSTYVDNTETTVENTVARYDDAVTKNQSLQTAENEFMGRVASGKLSYSGSNSLLNALSDNTPTIIIILALVSLTAVGGYFLIIKRRREINR